MNSKRFKFEHFTCNKQKPQSYEVQFLRYRVRQNFLSCWVIFCPLTLLTTQKIKIWKKLKKKTLEILSFYTCAPQMTIIWCMVSKISSTTDIIFCHFGNPGNQNFEMKKKAWWYYPNVYHKWKSYDVWFLRYGARHRIFSHFGPFFALLPH